MGGLTGISSGYGLQGWMEAFDRSASVMTDAASAAASDPAQSPASGAPDLVDGIVGSDLAAFGAKASIAALRTADEMLGTLIDLRA